MESKQSKHIIEVSREFNVDVETLYHAWTREDHLIQWWHPMGENLTKVENDLRDGGAVAYYIGESGLEVTGIYREAVPHKKLVYTWIWNMNDKGSTDGYTLNVEFSSEPENKSKLHVIQEGFSAAEFLQPHQEGWDKGLDDLGAYLSRQAADRGLFSRS